MRDATTAADEPVITLREVLGLARRCLHYVRPVRGHLALLVTAAVVLALLTIPLGWLLTDLMFNRLLVGEPLTAAEARWLGFAPEHFVSVEALGLAERQALRDTIVRLLLALLVGLPGVAALAYYGMWILQHINQALRVALVERIQALSLRFHADSRVGDAIYRVYQDSAMVTGMLINVLAAPARTLFGFVTSVVVVSVFDPRLTVALCLLWLPFLAFGAWFTPRLQARFRRARETNSALMSGIQETVTGLRAVVAYGAQPRASDDFDRRSRGAFDAAYAARSLYTAFEILAFVMASIALVGMESWIGLRAAAGDATLGQRALLAFGFATFNLGAFNAVRSRALDGTNSIEVLFSYWAKIQDVAVGMRRVFEFVDAEPEVRDADDARPVPEGPLVVEYADVRFAYAEDRPVLDGASLRCEPGTVTAIVGPSGAGKTTLVSLLLRLFDPDAGTITLGGVDLRALELASVRAHVSVALQDTTLFATSVRDNIRYAVPAARPAAVEAAAHTACADAFIGALPKGYDTVVGDRGARLSAGQRQRIAIARALIKDAPVLILDEPTAALDAETELAVLGRLAEWGRERTILLVTHRLSTIRRADQIAVLDGGRIAECGDHETLLARPDGRYRALALHEAALADLRGDAA